MIAKYRNKGIIDNVFVIVDAEGLNKKAHFMNNSAAFVSTRIKTKQEQQKEKKMKNRKRKDKESE